MEKRVKAELPGPRLVSICFQSQLFFNAQETHGCPFNIPHPQVIGTYILPPSAGQGCPGLGAAQGAEQCSSPGLLEAAQESLSPTHRSSLKLPPEEFMRRAGWTADPLLHRCPPSPFSLGPSHMPPASSQGLAVLNSLPSPRAHTSQTSWQFSQMKERWVTLGGGRGTQSERFRRLQVSPGVLV